MSGVSAVTELLKALAEFSWPAAVALILWWFHAPLRGILDALKAQIWRGASVKYGEIELHGIQLDNFPLAAGSVYEKVGADDQLLSARHEVYRLQKNVFLVHRAVKTQEVHKGTGKASYDISVYLIAHKSYGALNDVQRVEYYFGKYFDRKTYSNGAKYIVKNSKNGFAVRTTAYGPTLCEARLYFHDGSSAMVNRYLDFEGSGYEFDPNVNAFDQG
ncbi:pYEATS domain-containing protein [Rhizobium leguminosarum]|uniref:pYEATS domain-containing protein n=1 Tax=Rhizobium leguminosarum TaxID=384 RepID=UPI0014426936|nr:pYEATS domain-containing protein [Rhizobium leguminosarum]MBY5867380.1 hypothetical protein [Rhizobium leguminosarum]NKK99569.1 hypothetical protein [Rhizobium leguminosarum bv. viciae]NKM05203.1 hypothetical protein [Rhizobium leguminosarum bv. viciae]